jgi:hypothetical protein
MLKVHIRETQRNGRTFTSTHRTTNPNDAVDRALVQHFGRNAGFALNLELTGRVSPRFALDYPVYGQVVIAAGRLRGNTLTGTVSVSIDQVARTI